MIMMRHFSFRLGVNRAAIFWNLTQRRIAVSYRRFGTNCLSYFKGQAVQDDYHYDDNEL